MLLVSSCVPGPLGLARLACMYTPEAQPTPPSSAQMNMGVHFQNYRAGCLIISYVFQNFKSYISTDHEIFLKVTPSLLTSQSVFFTFFLKFVSKPIYFFSYNKRSLLNIRKMEESIKNTITHNMRNQK